MEPSETASHYDRVAQWYQNTISKDYGLAQLDRAMKFVPCKGAALDVGCGSEGRFLDALKRQGFTPEGMDISGEMVRLVRKRHPGLTFHTADICTWDLPRKYILITAWDSTFHLPLDRQESVLRKLCAGLETGGILLFTCGGMDEPGEISGGFAGETFDYSSLGVEEFLRLLRECGCTCRHLEFDQHPEKHVYIIAQKL
jgi:SAM-dependent methyltransferase